MVNRSRISEKSNVSTINMQCGNKEMEYFWSVVLNAEKRNATWIVNSSDNDEEDGLEHTLFLKSAVLGASALHGEQNIVILQSIGDDGKVQKGAIANLTRGQNAMTSLDITVSGKIGGTFILTEGSGPVAVAGNHLVGKATVVLYCLPREQTYQADDYMDQTRADGENTADEDDYDRNDETDEYGESEGEEAKSKTVVKRKGTPKAMKQKKTKMNVDDEDEEDVEEKEDDDEDDDDDDYDFDDSRIKKTKKGKVPAKKGDKAKTKQDKDSGKKVVKAVKK